MFKELVKLADYLDSKGLTDKADAVDSMLKGAQQDGESPFAERMFGRPTPQYEGGFEEAAETEVPTEEYQFESSGLSVSKKEVGDAFKKGARIHPHSEEARPYFAMQKDPVAWGIVKIMHDVFTGAKSFSIKDSDQIIAAGQQQGYSVDTIKELALNATTYIGIITDINKMYEEEVKGGRTQEPTEEGIQAIREYNLQLEDIKKQISPYDIAEFESVSLKNYFDIKINGLTMIAQSIVEDFFTV